MPRILIIGSCVSRDIFEYDEMKRFELVGYFARSSMASLSSRKLRCRPDISLIESAFQRRIVGFDIDRVFLDSLDPSQFDVLLVDLIDERFHLFELEPGAYVTASNELFRSGLFDNVDKTDERWLKSGSPGHLVLWLEGIKKLVFALTQQGAIHKLIVNKVFWSWSMDDGTRSDDVVNRQLVLQANEYLSWMYRQLENLLPSAQFIDHPRENLRLSRSHKWGIAPFNYTEAYYRDAIAMLARIAHPRPIDHIRESHATKTDA